MPRTPILAFALLAACATPAPEYFGADRADVTVDGYRFTVYRKGDRAEVIRRDYLGLSARAEVPGLMVRAVRQATGCEPRADSMVTGLPGDTGEARFHIDC